jgi:hypothetical protein
MSPLVFVKAQIFCYRIFDIADEIDLEKARTVLTADVRRLKLSREGSQYLELPNPPLAVELGRRSLAVRGNSVAVDAVARVFDHGAASILLKVPIPPGTELEQLIPIADELYDSASVDQLSLELLEGLRRALEPASQGRHLWDQTESYSVIFAERLEGNPTAKQIQDLPELARLLLGEIERESLSDYERNEVTQHRFSYRESDLAIIDWNSAFVYEPSGSLDIPDILEICNAQLLELRFYDNLLDANIRRIYDEVQRKRRRWYSIFRSPYNLLARRVLATALEMSEFVERVENSLKIIGDFYLAKVYEAALRRLRIPAWQATVTRKQELLAQVYELLKGEVDINRSLTLEFTVVVLIVTELLLAIASILSRRG